MEAILASWPGFAGRNVDGGAPDAPVRNGNAAGVLVVCLIVAAVVGLVGFAIGRATLPQGVFISDFPDGWGPIGFEIPAIVVGALAAAFFIGGGRLSSEAGAKEGADGGWPRLDNTRALMIAAAALFLAFAALQYDYRLLNEVTKFSAGPVVVSSLLKAPRMRGRMGTQAPNYSKRCWRRRSRGPTG